MSFLFHPLKITDVISFAWSVLKSLTAEYYRYFYREEVVVRITTGQVKGYKIASGYNYEYYNFIGIPYAKPPVGELRFKEPRPFEPATNDEIVNEKFARRGSMSCQPDLLFTKITMGTENCLHLSVFTHDIRPSTLKPCMVWIHGGSFIYGSNTKDLYNPEFLLRKQIVLISINYRLGAFGFLSLKDPELGIPGNAGLKDQVMALKWVKQNCAHFGGDPDNITVIGESAGAASVSMHMLSNQSKNLFHKAIVMSGTAFAPWSLSLDGGNWAQQLAKKLGWNGMGGESACLHVLQKASAHSIIQAQDKLLTFEDFKQIRFIAFSPVLEPYDTPQCFLRQFPSELIGSAWSKHVPTILGTCANEGLLFYKSKFHHNVWILSDDQAGLPVLKNMPEILTEFNILTAMATMEFNATNIQTDKCKEINQQLENFYSEQVATTATAAATIQKRSGKSPISIDPFLILHDKAFAHPIHRLIVSRIKYQHAPTYLLRFDFESTYSVLKRTCVGEQVPGVCHGDDVSYYFRLLSSSSQPAQHTDEWKTMERMCEIFSAFAAVGDPNNQLIEPIQWNPLSFDTNANDEQYDGNYKSLNISNDISYIDWIDLKRMRFWDKIYVQLGINP